MKLKIFLTIILTLIGWILGFELIFPGMWSRVPLFISHNPIYFLSIIISPWIIFFSLAKIWQIILSCYNYKINSLRLTKFVIGDFGISFLMPFLGGIGRLARAALLCSSGVKATVALSSVVIEGIIFALQIVLVTWIWIVLIHLGIIDLGGEVLLVLQAWLIIILLGLLLFLIVAKLKHAGRFLIIVKKICNRPGLIVFFKELIDGFEKIFSLSRKKILTLLGWIIVWFSGSLVEVWLIIKLIEVPVSWELMFLLQFAITAGFILLISPCGLGTVDTLVYTIFATCGIYPEFSFYFMIFWRLKNLFYVGISWGIIGNVFYPKANLIKTLKMKKRHQNL